MKEKETDIRCVDIHDLRSINSVKIDPEMSREERMRSFVEQIGDPYCYRDGDTVVKISYADTDVTLEDRLRAYIQTRFRTYAIQELPLTRKK